MVNYRYYTKEQRRILSKKMNFGKLRPQKVTGGFSDCQVTLRKFTRDNPLRHKRGHPQKLKQYQVAFIVEKGKLPKKPWVLSHRLKKFCSSTPKNLRWKFFVSMSSEKLYQRATHNRGKAERKPSAEWLQRQIKRIACALCLQNS